MACSSSNRNCGQRLGQLGLADAGRAQEHERADRPVRVLQAGTGAPHRRWTLPRLPRTGRRRACRAALPCASSFSRSPSSMLDRPERRSSARRPARCGSASRPPRPSALSGLPSPFGSSAVAEAALEIGDHAVGELARPGRDCRCAAPVRVRCGPCRASSLSFWLRLHAVFLGLPARW